MNDIEARELRYFLAVADELHFGRAAERLGIAQPPLSRAIARLERRLGVALFERTSRTVHLTAPGSVLVVEARKVLRAMDRAVARTRRSVTPRLRVAAAAGTGAARLRELVAANAAAGGAPVDIVFTRDQASAVRDGSADVAVMCATEDLRGLDVAELGKERPVALVPADHPLASQPHTNVGRLRQERAYRAMCPADVGLDEIVDCVALGRLVVVVGDGVKGRIGDGVAAVNVSDLPSTSIVLGWPQDASDAMLAIFVAAATRAMDAHPRMLSVS